MRVVTFATMHEEHQNFMQRCIQLAYNGLGTTAPNPLVGCVIVHNNKIIGEGWHYKSGTPHAEVHAIQSVKNQALLAESTLYVSLEPCAHFGKTSPCANLIVEKKIPKVVIGSHDPNPQVAGKGVLILKNAGIEVISGVCQERCDQLNKTFFHFHKTKKPYVILKWAQSADGFMDAERSDGQKGSHVISSLESRVFAHQLRSQCDAILIGSGTAVIDEPTLTTRLFAGKNPQKIILDRSAILPLHSKAAAHAWIYSTTGIASKRENTERFILPTENFMALVFTDLASKGIQSVLVEGGARILNHFIAHDLWHESYQIISPKNLGSGLLAPQLSGFRAQTKQLNIDIINHYNRS